MRSDMHHLLVERGHSGRGWSADGPKGWAGRCRPRYGDEDDDGWQPPRHRPQFSENLAPLRRFLAAQVGRPWNAVYAEIRAGINTDNAVQFHILQHLYDDIARHVTISADGSLWCQTRWGKRQPLSDRWSPRLYICPRTGLLRRTPRRQPPTKPQPDSDRLPGPKPDQDYRRLAGHWFAVWWGQDPTTGTEVIVRKRQLNRRELRDLGLRRR